MSNLIVAHLRYEIVPHDEIKSALVGMTQYVGDLTIGAAKRQSVDNQCFDFGFMLVLSDGSRNVNVFLLGVLGSNPRNF